MDVNESSRSGQAAIGEFENAVVVAPMRDIAIAVPDHEARMALVDKEGGDELLLAARSFFFARGGKKNGEVYNIGMADEMLDAIDDEIIAFLNRRAFHAAHIGARTRFGHCQAVRF